MYSSPALILKWCLHTWMSSRPSYILVEMVLNILRMLLRLLNETTKKFITKCNVALVCELEKLERREKQLNVEY